MQKIVWGHIIVQTMSPSYFLFHKYIYNFSKFTMYNDVNNIVFGTKYTIK